MMALYDSIFSHMDVLVSQLLVSNNDFHDRTFKANLKVTVDALLSSGVIPIFNENDATAGRTTENGLDPAFLDNDALAALLAEVLEADLLMLLTDVEGLFTGPPSDPKSQYIPTFSPKVHLPQLRFGATSTVGRGGMMSKLNAAWECARRACPAVIANGKLPDVILRVVAGQELGTLFSVDGAQAFEEMENRNTTQLMSNRELALAARAASRHLQTLPTETRRAMLERVAQTLLDHEAEASGRAWGPWTHGHAQPSCAWVPSAAHSSAPPLPRRFSLRTRRTARRPRGASRTPCCSVWCSSQARSSSWWRASAASPRRTSAWARC